MQLSRGSIAAFSLLVACSGEIATGDESRPDGTFNPGVSTAMGGAAAPPLGSDTSPAAAAPGASASGGPGALVPGGASTTLNLSGAPQYSRLVRLTNAQWAHSVRDILKLETLPGLDANFQQPVAGTTDFTNNELVLDVDQRAASDYRDAAEQLATSVTSSSAALARVYAGTDAAGFIATVGRRAYRRPLTIEEQATYKALFDKAGAASAGQDAFASGANLVLRAMLQSPYFLYRTELGDRGTPLNAYEMAAKLSLWLRGTTPSDALLDAGAGPGRFETPEGAAMLAQTMLTEPAAVDVMRDFHSELYHFDRYTTISKIGVSGYEAGLNDEYYQSSLRYFDNLFSRNLGVTSLLTSTTGFVGPLTARLYGLSAPATDYAETDLGPQRVGYFSQIPFLSLYALNNDPDSIHRGVSMNLDVLCTVLGPPAAMLPPIPPLEPGQTNRQRISKLTEGCGGVCHNQQINPLGFAFEHFDGMGRYRDMENGNLPIDSHGSFVFSEGAQSFANAAELMNRMAAGKQAHTCYAKKLASFGLQRDIVAQDLPLLDSLASVSLANGSIKDIIVALVRSDAFRVRAGALP